MSKESGVVSELSSLAVRAARSAGGVIQPGDMQLSGGGAPPRRFRMYAL
jgi:hypothetical protein